MPKIMLHKYGEVYPIELHVSKYTEGDNLAITMDTWDQGYPEPWDTLTVNLTKCDPDCAFIDTNNNGDSIVDWLISNKLGKLTGRTHMSGYCIYPEFKFDLKAVENVK